LLESAKESGAEPKTAVTGLEKSHYLLTFSAASKGALHSIVRKHEIYREALAHRAYSVVQTGQETEPLRTSTHERVTNGPPNMVFVFTGQGAQYAAMGASLMTSNSTFLRSIENMENVLAQCAKPPVWSLKGTFL
jgi:acyl transferase domain-containing protein